MFCPNCGAENQDDAAFCENCGTDISQAFEEAKAELKEQGKTERPAGGVTALEPYVYKTAAAKSVGKHLKKSAKIAIAAVLAVIVAAAVLYNVGLKMYSPQTSAKNFFEAVRSSKWDTAYSYLSVSENDFINKANFIKETKSSDVPKVVNYSVKNETGSKDDVSAAADGSGGDTQLSKTVTIQYTTQNGFTPQTLKVHLVKQAGKKLLLFDDWKVSASDFVSTNVLINVPKECTAYLDNTKIADKYIDKSNTGLDSSANDANNMDNSSNQQNGLQTYTYYKIPSIFSGKYTLKVTSPYTEDYKSNINVNGNDASFNVDNLSLKKDILDKLSGMPEQALNDIYAAAFAGKSFDSVKSYFTSDSESQSGAESAYNEIVNNVAKDNTAGFKNITFTNFNSNVTNSSATGNMSVQVDTQADYSYTYTYPSYDGGESAQDYTGNSSANMSFTYSLCDGKWLISGISGLVIYY